MSERKPARRRRSRSAAASRRLSLREWPRRRKWAAVLLLAAVTVMITGGVHLARHAAFDTAELARLERVGVEVTARLDFVDDVKLKRDYTKEFLVVYSYGGAEYSPWVYCDDCEDGDRVPVRVDPDDPAKYVMEYGSSAGDVSAFDMVLFSIPAAGLIGVLMLIDRRRWWLAVPNSAKRRR